LDKAQRRGRVRGTIATTVGALSILGCGALTAQAQVNLPQLPQAPDLPVPVPSLPSPAPQPAPAPPRVALPSPPPIPVPEPVQRIAPAAGELVGGSGAGGTSGGPVSGVRDVVNGTAERVLGGGGSGSPAGATGGRVADGPGLGGARQGAAAAGASGAALGVGSGGGGGGGSAAGEARAGGRAGARGRDVRRPARVRERLAHRRAVERIRERLVERLDGCLDRLPRMQRITLILRYGVGPLRDRTRRETARLLGVSRGRARLLERGGLRTLAGFGKAASCAHTGVSQTTLAGAYLLLTGASAPTGDGLSAPIGAGVALATLAAVALDDGEGAVAGARESRGERRGTAPDPEEGEEDGPVSSAGPSLGDPFGAASRAVDDPLILLLLAVVVAGMVSAARQVKRALH
jgi:hypothetical protein